MKGEKSRKIATTLIQDLIPFHAGGGDGPACSGCGAPIELEQPNMRNPDRLLGVCTKCGIWEVIEVVGRGESAWVTVVPREFWPGRAPADGSTALPLST